MIQSVETTCTSSFVCDALYIWCSIWFFNQNVSNKAERTNCKRNSNRFSDESKTNKYECGKTVTDLSRELKLSHSTVSSIIQVKDQIRKTGKNNKYAPLQRFEEKGTDNNNEPATTKINTSSAWFERLRKPKNYHKVKIYGMAASGYSKAAKSFKDNLML